MASLLIVDDDHDGRVALCEFLSRKGYQVTGVPSGRAAMASFLAHVPDLVILDLLMPGMDGGGLLQMVRVRPSPAGAAGRRPDGLPRQPRGRAGTRPEGQYGSDQGQRDL